MAEDPQALIVSHMGNGRLLVYQPSTGGGLNLSSEEAKELIKLLSNYVEPENERLEKRND